MKNIPLATNLALAFLSAALCLTPRWAEAVISGPYLPDANTLHLWHMDSGTAPVPDAATPALNLAALGNGATLDSPSFPGFGKALSTVDGGQALTNLASAIDAYLAPLALVNAAGDNVPWSFADPVTRQFTFEAVVWIGFDPTLNFGTVASGGNGRAQTMQIISGEQETAGGGTRSWQMRLIPVGIASLSSDINAVRLEFINVNNGANVQNIIASLPSAPPHAIVSNGWYHVAVTYNGQPGTSDNLKFYWTAMDPTLTSANEFLSTSMNLNLNAGPVDFCVGNTGRSPPNGNFIGLIDEVRISSVARSAQGMMFASANVSIDLHPKSQIVAAGDGVSLVASASGFGQISYQWQHYSTNLPSATNSTLVISNILSEQAGPYQLIAANAVSSATSAVATVRVGIPVPELFATGLSAERTPIIGGLVDPHYTLTQSDDPNYPGPALYAISTPPGAWLANNADSQWIAPGDGANLISGNYTYRTGFLLDSGDPSLAQLNVRVIADNVLLDLVLNGTSTGLTNAGVLNSFSLFTLTNGFVAGLNTLDFVVSNYPGTGPNLSGFRAELSGAMVPLTAAAPQILVAPVNVSTQSQQNASFSVAASGSPTLTYQWYHGPNLLPGRTDRKLSLYNLAVADAGTYTVYVSNSLGWASASASLTVTTPPALAWTGQNSSDWDTLTQNWLNLGTSAGSTFAPFNDVLFDSRGAAQANVNVTEAVSPNSITVDAANDYTLTSFAANGWLTGSFPLIKKNSGRLTLSLTNLSKGPVTIAGGVLQVGNYDYAASLGEGTVSISNNAALVFGRADTWLVRNTITGGGAVTNMTGTTVLVASNTYTGPTVVQQGTLVARNGAALGTADAGTVVEPFGQLFLDSAVDIPNEAIRLNGSGPAYDGALRKGGGSVSAIGGLITLAGEAMIKVDGGSTLRLTNAAGINAATHALTLWADGNGGTGSAFGPLSLGSNPLLKDGPGAWQLLNTGNSGTGGTVINAGTLQLGNGVLSGNLPGGPVTDNGTLVLFGAGDQTVANEITGMGGITHSSTNTTTLVASNSYAGATAANGGTLLVANGYALGTVDGNTTIAGNVGAVSRVAFSNNVTVPEPFLLAARQPVPDISALAPHLLNLSGTNTLTGPITVTTGGNQYNIESAAGRLICAGDYSQVSGTGDRFLNLQGAAEGIWSGAINNGVARVNVLKRGSGVWTLAGSNSYSGPTVVSEGTLLVNGVIGTNAVTVSGGLLGGTGLVLGAATVQSAGTLAPGVAGIGTLTISNTLVMQTGSTNVFDVNATSGAGDQVAGLSSVTYGGTLVLNNLGGPFTTASAFRLFSADGYAGAFSAINPANPASGLAWDTSTLIVDGTLRVTTGSVTTPTNISYSFAGGVLQLTWPASYLGWIAQSNRTSVAESGAWFDIAGSEASTTLNIPVSPAEQKVFYRLRKP